MYTPVVEDYLKAIWMLQQTEAPVSTSRIAERLGLTTAAVTAMVKRLAEQKLLRHEPYYGVRLTAPMAPSAFSDVSGLIGAMVFGTCAYVVVVLLFRRALPLGRLAQ